MDLHSIFRRIDLALNISHGVTATDRPDLHLENESSWVIDHLQEIKDLEALKQHLISIGIYHECDCCNTNP